MIDLSTRYLGLVLRNPLVVSASPLGEVVGNLCRMEDAGAAAGVLPSLFEEQITLESRYLDRHLSQGTESSASFRPIRSSRAPTWSACTSTSCATSRAV